MTMTVHDLPIPLLVSPALFVLLGIGGIVLGRTAPAGRRALSVTAGALLLVSGFVDLVMWLASTPINDVLWNVFGGPTAYTVINSVFYVTYALAGAGLIVLAFAATRRAPKPAVHPVPSAPHPPQGPYGPGPIAPSQPR
ncbi:hypothetical protein AB0I72_03980 [Nocardiopsis sp. NPDC049922]|uniref:hypothetical protein n=1 Tax=Nocardiopsis sp. NPDC049922 TaxID=3155157 RepID=UPI0033D5F144